MSTKVLILASNYGLWAEELQAPWDALRKAGFEVTLATKFGKTPLPITVSTDPDFLDPVQKYHVNPTEVVTRVNEILDSGEWANPIRFEDAKMSDYDALVIVGGPGAALDIAGNLKVHDLVLQAYKDGKTIGALCYAVAALNFTRDPDNNNRSVIYGRKVVAHPHAWDFTADMSYPLVGSTPDNKGTDVVTSGFVFPLQYMTQDAVGPAGKVLSDADANRDRPQVTVDGQFVTGLSVESSRLFGETLVEVLSRAKVGAG
ncbi:MAG TPA: DJ-1/PfpI family protein [Candidatus Dormibacteraeota bacterium]|jgi:putative intracellular protease/amidase